jgi:hypothetical protein
MNPWECWCKLEQDSEASRISRIIRHKKFLIDRTKPQKKEAIFGA